MLQICWWRWYQYKLLCTISNNIEVNEDTVPRTKKIPYCAVKFEASEEKRIVHESLYCCTQVGNINWTIVAGNDDTEDGVIAWFFYFIACQSASAREVPVDGYGELISPGYPYDIPEQVSCRWLLRAPDDQVSFKTL